MLTQIRGEFYDAVILQKMVPEVADVSVNNYEAKKLDKDGNDSTKPEDLRPFIIAHPLPLRMKVQTWLGKEITWTFNAGEDPMPLRKIFASPAPVLVENGEPTATTVTSIQISY
jgi:hypothetical protein